MTTNEQQQAFNDKLESITPANPILAFKPLLIESDTLSGAIGISEERTSELNREMKSMLDILSGNKLFGDIRYIAIGSPNLLAAGSYIANTPQELMYIAVNLAKLITPVQKRSTVEEMLAAFYCRGDASSVRGR